MKDMTSYPKAVVLRKSMVVFCIIGLLLLASLILVNLYQASGFQKMKIYSLRSAVDVMATKADTEWYQAKTNSAVKFVAVAPANETISTPNQTEAQLTALTQLNNDSEHENSADLIKERLINEQKAMTAPINSNQLAAPSSTSADSSNQSHPNEETIAILSSPLSPYILQAGTVISGQLITGIQADLPGEIIGQVRANVYDSVTGRYLLIPQGAKLIGHYAAQTAYGQERIVVSWKRLRFPNGQQLNLPDMPASDVSGYTGLHDKVNHHYGQQIIAALLTSTFNTSAAINPSRFISDSHPPTLSQALSENAEIELANTGSTLTANSFNIQPTLTIRPGMEFNLIVTQDVIFPGPYPFSS
jgi:type IV secretory pathway VirB10-like protein